PPSRLFAQGAGLLLFLFIPAVLFLFVRHPAPIGGSLLAGIALMLGHRFLARPYMEQVRQAKCLWCNRLLPPEAPSEPLVLESGGERIEARCCPGHRGSAARFFTFLGAFRRPLALGIFAPLLALLAALAAAAFGRAGALPQVTAVFQLIVGLAVNFAAWGYLGLRERAPYAVPFPAHNFFLLGVRNLLWVFRLVGIWWIWVGARALFFAA
ncbi:MAG TPA: hypothetical protein VN783_11125, partial [Thermoanaerobaculia bacterium]|nr:hypothetical protein [Thermoanaerobaculia bacterium]